MNLPHGVLVYTVTKGLKNASILEEGAAHITDPERPGKEVAVVVRGVAGTAPSMI